MRVAKPLPDSLPCDMESISRRRVAFAEAYLATGNATAAARKAGYAPGNAGAALAHPHVRWILTQRHPHRCPEEAVGVYARLKALATEAERRYEDAHAEELKGGKHHRSRAARAFARECFGDLRESLRLLATAAGLMVRYKLYLGPEVENRITSIRIVHDGEPLGTVPAAVPASLGNTAADQTPA